MPTKSCLNIGGLNDWAGLVPQLLGGLEPESLQEFTPMPPAPPPLNATDC